MPPLPQRCSSLYVDQTSRLLKTRISEHLGISALGDLAKRVSPPPISILSHHCDTGHPVSLDDFTVLSSSFNCELLVRESLLIRKLNPSLNANMGCFPLSYYKTFRFLTFPLHFSLLFPFVFFTSVLTPISR